jgi:membrane-associated protease RseP (regulator of RpoE activity)
VPDHEETQLDDVTVAELVVGRAPESEIVQAELADPLQARRRRVVLPIALFLLTCASTFFAGATGWLPDGYLMSGWGSMGAEADPYFMLPVRRAVVHYWPQGLIYMGCVLAILLTHEMGHFIMTLIYRVRSTLPYFVPFPISPIGTMGAVIGMDGASADRRQIFDIGLAGPLAGLVIAIPVAWAGAAQLNLTPDASAEHILRLPLAMRLMVDHLQPGAYNHQLGIPFAQLNAYFMAGWVGMLVTGLNMVPVSQLDGGHVTYALFGRWAHWLARGFMLTVFIYMAAMFYLYEQFPMWMLMAVLVLLIGTDHPPTRDDRAKLGWFRVLLGIASLAIPVFCFVPNPF